MQISEGLNWTEWELNEFDGRYTDLHTAVLTGNAGNRV
jgi:hypothetical protein